MEQVKSMEEFRLKVIEEINLVRKNPQDYAEKVRKFATFFKGKILKIPEQIPIMTTEGSSAFEEAACFLDNLDSLAALKYSPGLTHSAHDALIDIQKLEDVDMLGDLNIDTYLDKHGQVIGHFAQAVDFGSSLPELVVINLLVDDGDLNRGNRANIINPKYKLIGVSTGSHSVYHNATVLMYARHFFSLNEVPGDLSDENYESKEDKKQEIKEINQKLNVVRRTSLAKNDFDNLAGKFINVKIDEEKLAKIEEDDVDLPEGVARIERQEKVVTENGFKKKIVKLIKHMEDGTIETEIFKEKI
jgi:hypothetical protein